MKDHFKKVHTCGWYGFDKNEIFSWLMSKNSKFMAHFFALLLNMTMTLSWEEIPFATKTTLFIGHENFSGLFEQDKKKCNLPLQSLVENW